MTLEERIDQLEITSRTHDAMLNLLISILERQDSRLEEQRHDNAMTRRLWVKLAAKHGWIDEDGLFDDDDLTP